MHRLILAAGLAGTPLLAQQPSPEPVRVSIRHMLADADAEPVRLWPDAAAAPRDLFAPLPSAGFDARLLDLTEVLGGRRFGRGRVRVTRAGDELVVVGDGVERDALRDLTLDGIDAYAPVVHVDVAIHRAAPVVAPAALPAGEVGRHLAGAPLHQRQVAAAGGRVADVALGPRSCRLQLRVEPHLLPEGDGIALLCAFAFDRRGRDGGRRWTAGTAAGVAPSGGALVLTFPDHVVVLRATHAPRSLRGLALVPWSLLTSRSLRHEPVAGGDELLALSATPLGQAAEEDWLRAGVERAVMPGRWRDGTLSGDSLPQGLLVGGEEEALAGALPKVRDVVAGFAAGLGETARLDVALEDPPGITAALRLPVLPGRVACVLHAAWPAAGAGPRGVLLALRHDGATATREADVRGFVQRVTGAGLGARDGAPLAFQAGELPERGAVELAADGDLAVTLAREGDG